MPEGHTVHRHARRQRRALAGHRIATTSPQGRFAAGAARLSGRTLCTFDAYGKHLLYRWDGGEVLHVHLGLFGRFRVHAADPPEPSENTRLAMVGGGVTIYLSGPAICELIDPETEDALRARLGPDPLGNDAHSARLAEFTTRLVRRRIPIGAALLDQRVVAGIGNVYRAEVLFRTGIDPHLPANALGDEAAERLWDESVSLLRLGVESGRIITVDPADVGARRRRDLARDERLYVYKRHGEACRRCGAAIASAPLANRRIWWCRRCQPPGAGS